MPPARALSQADYFQYIAAFKMGETLDDERLNFLIFIFHRFFTHQLGITEKKGLFEKNYLVKKLIKHDFVPITVVSIWLCMGIKFEA